MNTPIIVFDVDGTLYDTKPGIISALNEVLLSYGNKPIRKDDENKYIGPPIKESLMVFNDFDEESAINATKLYRNIYVTKYVHLSRLYPEMREVLDWLFSNNYQMAIATMKTYPQIDKLLKHSNCYKYFSIIQSASEDGSLSKKNMLEAIKEGISDPKNYIMIGDTITDYTAAIQTGFHFIYASYGYGRVPYSCSTINSPIDLIKTLS